MTTRYMALPLALALALAVPASVQAIGLGQLEVKSGLNQPLLAEIPILSANPEELEQLEIRLASPEAFARVGLERPTALTTNLQFSVSKNSHGQSIIQVSTSDKFVEPFLSFLIEADWGKGRVTREYTALIDPPYIAAAVIEPMQAPTITSVPETVASPAPMPLPSVTPETEHAPESTPVAETAALPEPIAAPIPEVVPQTAPEPRLEVASQPTEIGPIRSGQTLSAIAQSLQHDQGVSLNQMMLALLRANPDAFIQNNINRLKSGSVLRIPSHQEAVSLSAREATALVHEQINTWRSSRQPVIQPGESVAETNMTPNTPKAAMKSTAATHLAASGKPSAPSVSRLEIVPPAGKTSAHGAQSGAAAGAGGAELRVELVQVHEELAARTAEVTELKSRVADMEKQDADRQRLLEMKNSQLNDLEKRLKQLEEDNAANAKQAIAAPSVSPESAAVETSKPLDATTTWYLNPFLLGGGSLVLIGGLAMVLRRSKPGSKNEIHISRLSQDEALLASMASDPIETTLDDDTAESDSAHPFAGPTLEVERQALEAEVRSHPDNLESHLNLLRYHYAQNKPADFEAAAHAMRLQIKNTMDPRWREVVIMGAALIPENALFSHTGWNSKHFSDMSSAPVSSESDLSTTSVNQAPLASTDMSDKHKFVQEWDDKDQGIDLTPLSTYADDSAPADMYRHEAEAIAGHEGSATRLELAKAYLDIGDIEGARGMLEEVLAEGGAAAKAEAERILNQMS